MWVGCTTDAVAVKDDAGVTTCSATVGIGSAGWLRVAEIAASGVDVCIGDSSKKAADEAISARRRKSSSSVELGANADGADGVGSSTAAGGWRLPGSSTCCYRS